MYEAFKEMPGAVGEQNDDTRRMAILERFLKLKPPNFAGKHDPPSAEEWLKSVKKMFDTLNVPEIYRVEFATFLFEGDVRE
ncbi:hypothetical protein PanWU01x14_128410 [Parasponia andersonii]|uniref:Uncharacterized protein n=1 Tax=Parasponia andersonii TaxID=3476 RepID=A0A2P5CS30_PARAD|nr:hypothetical protein PanWU01x14_128410 [Parasponia andersonii]